MRSKTTKRILEETPQEVKDKVVENTNRLLKDNRYIKGFDPYDENSVSKSVGAEINVMNLDLSDDLKNYLRLQEDYKKYYEETSYQFREFMLLGSLLYDNEGNWIPRLKSNQTFEIKPAKIKNGKIVL